MFTLVGLFPKYCEKHTLRFYFDYSVSKGQSLDYKDFKLFFGLMGLEVLNKANKLDIMTQLMKKTRLDTNTTNVSVSEAIIEKQPCELVLN